MVTHRYCVRFKPNVRNKANATTTINEQKDQWDTRITNGVHRMHAVRRQQHKKSMHDAHQIHFDMHSIWAKYTQICRDFSLAFHSGDRLLSDGRVSFGCTAAMHAHMHILLCPLSFMGLLPHIFCSSWCVPRPMACNPFDYCPGLRFTSRSPSYPALPLCSPVLHPPCTTPWSIAKIISITYVVPQKVLRQFSWIKWRSMKLAAIPANSVPSMHKRRRWFGADYYWTKKPSKMRLSAGWLTFVASSFAFAPGHICAEWAHFSRTLCLARSNIVWCGGTLIWLCTMFVGHFWNDESVQIVLPSSHVVVCGYYHQGSLAIHQDLVFLVVQSLSCHFQFHLWIGSMPTHTHGHTHTTNS